MTKNKNKIDNKKAFKYYCLGLNSKEIAKLLGCSFRTIQNYMNVENWKQKRSSKMTKKPNNRSS